MNCYYNPTDIACKNPIGAFACDEIVHIHVFKNGDGEEDSAENCNIILNRDGQYKKYFPMKRTADGWHIALRFHQCGLYFYHFQIGGRYLACDSLHNAVFVNSNPASWQITVYRKGFSTPEWFKGGIMYQIFPDRFCRSGEMPPLPHNKVAREWGQQPYFRPKENGKVLNNDFFGGNFKGIDEKLDYLTSLGVTTIYFNPIFEAYSNHRYDTADYLAIDPLLGTEDDFDALIEDAKSNGIRVILDGVFNHTGSDSRYFNQFGTYNDLGAYQSKQSPYADWYTFHIFPTVYDSWWGIETLPAINEHSESFQKFMFGDDGVLRHWLRRGIGGYRLDVADELPDFFVKKLRSAVKEEMPDALVLGEVWEDASNKIAYGERRQYFQGEELDSVMNYPLKDAIIQYLTGGNTRPLREAIAMLIDNYPKCVLDCLMNILGTHDTVRILTVLGGKPCRNKEEMAVTKLSDKERALAITRLHMAAVLQFTLPGVPCIYYGDEIGMEGYLDPFCRGCYNWEHPDKSLLAFYRRLGTIREKSLLHVFRDGVYREIFADNTCLVYERRSAEGAAYIFVNNSRNEYNVHFCGAYLEYLTQEHFDNEYHIMPYSCGIIGKA